MSMVFRKMEIINTHVVPKAAPKQRLSDYLIGIFEQLPSRKSVKKAIKRGEVLLDGETGHTGDWVSPGQKIDLLEPAVNARLYEMKIPVVYEDDHLALLNKPGGLPTSGNQFRNLENTLPYNLKPSPEPDAYRLPRAVHRLDSATCGLVLVAKTAKARMELGRQFEKRKVEKTYQAVVIGEIAEEGEFRSEVDEKPALTRFKRVQTAPSLRFGHLSLVDLYPETGRTHQLRIHLSEAGFPILGDKLYGKEGLFFRGKGLFLCSAQLSFAHPSSKERRTFTIDPPAKFQKKLDREAQR